MTSDEVLEKLRRCLRLQQQGATPGEVEAALAAARRIAMRHEIDLATLEMDAPKEETLEESYGREDVPIGFRRSISQRLAMRLVEDYFRVRVIVWSPHMAILGKVTDVAFGSYAFGFIIGEFQRLWKQYQLATGSRVSSRNSFVYGLYQGLDRVLKAEEESSAKDRFSEIRQTHGDAYCQRAERQLMIRHENEKVRMESHVREHFPRLQRMGGGRTYLRDRHAQSHGFDAGQKIKIRKPVDSSPRIPVLGWK